MERKQPDKNMSVDDGQTVELPREPLATPTGQADRLKLINVGPSADGRHVDLHFLTMANQVTSVHLDLNVAAGLCSSLGTAIAHLKAQLPPIARGRLN